MLDVASRLHSVHIDLQPVPGSSRVARQAIDTSIPDLSRREREDLKILIGTVLATLIPAPSGSIELDFWRVATGVRVEARANRIEEISEGCRVSTRILDRVASRWAIGDGLVWLFLKTSAPPADADETALFDSAAAGDTRAVEELISRYSTFALSLARRFRGGSVTSDDVDQVALIALNNAIDRFDPRRDVRFTSFAAPTIRGELKRWLRSSAWALRVPRRLQELNLEARHAFTDVSQRLGREPSTDELSASLDADPAEVALAMLAPMEAFFREGSGPERRTEASESIPSAEDTERMAIQRAELTRAVLRLRERERLILHLRFFEDLTQREIARRIGISQMHVSRLLDSALLKARRVLEETDRHDTRDDPVRRDCAPARSPSS